MTRQFLQQRLPKLKQDKQHLLSFFQGREDLGSLLKATKTSIGGFFVSEFRVCTHSSSHLED